MSRWRRPLLGRRSCPVLATFCAWEFVALLPRSPLPTLTSIVRRRRVLGVVLLVLLGHHWLIEGVPCG